MVRPLRVDVADGVYHVMSRGIDRSCIYRDQAGHRELRSRYSWLDVVSEVENISGKTWKSLQKRGEWERYLVYWGAQKYAGMTLKEIASACGFKDYGAVNMGIRRLIGRSSDEKTVRRRMDELDKKFKVQT